jgi:predicted acetyltransferase
MVTAVKTSNLIRVKLSMCVINYHGMETYWRSDLIAPPFLICGGDLDGSIILPPRKECPETIV